MKKFIKSILSYFLKEPYDWFRYFYSQSQRFYYNSAASLDDSHIEYIVTKLKVLTHEIDKGLNMPEPRKGFGKEKTEQMVQYMKKYNELDTHHYEYDAYIDAYEILKKYVENKDRYGLTINHIDFEQIPVDMRYQSDRVPVNNNTFTCDGKHMNFEQLAKSRHSIRYFKENTVVDESLINKSIQIARTAPSACNRQSTRIILINDKEKAKKVLDIQGGTRGFKNAENCILIASDLNSYWWSGEINTAYVDSGIFMMNLIYALKYYGIDSCPLIWDDNSFRRKELEKIVKLSPNYLITGVLAIGYADDKAKILTSPRRSVESIFIRRGNL